MHYKIRVRLTLQSIYQCLTTLTSAIKTRGTFIFKSPVTRPQNHPVSAIKDLSYQVTDASSGEKMML